MKSPESASIIVEQPIVSQSPERTFFTVSGTAPRKATVYLRLVFDGSPSQNWTSLHNVRGIVGPDLVSDVLAPGTYGAQLVDGQTQSVLAETTFTVSAP